MNFLKDMTISRLSLVRKPANRKPFLLLKSDEGCDDCELAKALHHHLDALLDIVGAAEDEKKAYEQVVRLLEDMGFQFTGNIQEQVGAVLNMLWTAKNLRDALSEVVGGEEEEDEEEYEVEKEELLEKAKVTTEQRYRLPARHCGYIDDAGRCRFPIHDAAHVRNALARFNQGHFPDKATKLKTLRKILRRARELGVEYDKEKWEAELERLSKSEEEVAMAENPRPEEGKNAGTQTDTLSISKSEWEEVLKKAKAAEELEQRLAKMEAEREREVYLRKAESYPHLGDREWVATLIRSLEKSGVDPQQVTERLSALEKQLSESELLKSKGTDATPDEGTSAIEREVDRLVQELVSKSSMSRSRAYAEAIRTLAVSNPEMYEEYVRAQRRKGLEG